MTFLIKYGMFKVGCKWKIANFAKLKRDRGWIVRKEGLDMMNHLKMRKVHIVCGACERIVKR